MDSDKKSLLTIIHRAYEEILALEMEHGITFSEEDFRPRIDYFHDAVRAYTSGETPYGDASSRLSIEQLSYDLEMLRYIQAHPAPAGRPSRRQGMTSVYYPDTYSPDASAGTEIVISGAGGTNLPALPGQGANSPPPPRMDRNTKMQLADMYKTYTVMFAAMLVETADKNYNSRIDEQNTAVEDMASLEVLIQRFMQAQTEMEITALADQMEDLAYHIENEELRHKILHLIHDRNQKRRMAEESAKKIREAMQEADREIARIETCHTRFLNSQLMVYQESLDVVKQLAQQGLNIAGKFIGAAASRDMGHMPGRGR
jgi:hypothetical protein